MLKALCFSLLALALAITLALSTAQAQTAPAAAAEPYPAKTIHLVVPWPAGGDTDIIARLIGQKLAEALGKPVIVENRQGGSGSVGTQSVVRAPADGYTLLVSSMGIHAMNQFLSRLDYDPAEDVAGVSMLVKIPSALVAHPSVPFNDVKGLVAAAKANPGKLNVASGSNAFRVFLEQLKTATDINVLYVPYRGSGPAVNDLLGGQVEMLIAGLPAVTPHLKAGKLKVIAVTNARRAAATPNVPTVGETVPGLEFDNWTGLFVRAGTPRPIIERLNAEVVRILNLPDVRERIQALGAEPAPSSADELSAIVKKDAERFGKVIKATGMKAE